MHMTPHIRPESLDHYIRRGRHLRSAAAFDLFAALGRFMTRAVERAFIRRYRMTRTPGCGCEA